MRTSAIQKKIYQTIKKIDDVEFLENIHRLVYDKAARSSLHISDEEWDEIERISKKAKKNIKNLKSWRTVKKELLSSL